MDVNAWLPTVTFIVGGLGIAWKFGGVIQELKTLLSVLTKDVVEVKLDLKEAMGRQEEIRADVREITTRLISVEQRRPARLIRR